MKIRFQTEETPATAYTLQCISTVELYTMYVIPD